MKNGGRIKLLSVNKNTEVGEFLLLLPLYSSWQLSNSLDKIILNVFLVKDGVHHQKYTTVPYTTPPACSESLLI